MSSYQQYADGEMASQKSGSTAPSSTVKKKKKFSSLTRSFNKVANRKPRTSSPSKSGPGGAAGRIINKSGSTHTRLTSDDDDQHGHGHGGLGGSSDGSSNTIANSAAITKNATGLSAGSASTGPTTGAGGGGDNDEISSILAGNLKILASTLSKNDQSDGSGVGGASVGGGGGTASVASSYLPPPRPSSSGAPPSSTRGRSKQSRTARGKAANAPSWDEGKTPAAEEEVEAAMAMDEEKERFVSSPNSKHDVSFLLSSGSTHSQQPTAGDDSGNNNGSRKRAAAAAGAGAVAAGATAMSKSGSSLNSQSRKKSPTSSLKSKLASVFGRKGSGSPDRSAPLVGGGAGGGDASGGGGGGGGRGKKQRRYRGFTSSISGLFRDEQLVCGAISCFGILLSSRTEYLLRSHRDHAEHQATAAPDGGLILHRAEDAAARKHNAKTRWPNFVLGIGLILTVMLVAVSYVVLPNEDSSVLERDINSIGGDDYGSQFNNNYDDDDAADDQAGDDGADDQAGGDDYQDQDDYYNDNNRRMIQTNSDSDTGHRHLGGAILRISDFSIVPVPWEWESEIGSAVLREEVKVVGTATANFRPSTILNYNQDGDEYYYDSDGNIHYGSDPRNTNTGRIARISIVCAFFLLLGTYGRRRRIQTRKEILQNRYHDDLIAGERGGATFVGKAHEGRLQGACAHTLCGCYPADPPFFDDEEDQDDFDDKYGKDKDDCCQSCFNCFSACCCGRIWPCGCYLQCLSMCAIAQEAREVYTLLPAPPVPSATEPSTMAVDYVTHEPWSNYAPALAAVQAERPDSFLKRISSLGRHFTAMSKLSKGLWAFFVLLLTFFMALLFFSESRSFGWANALVLLATFGQSFFILFIVHRIYTKSYLSLDAITKCFSAGFILAVPTAFVCETLIVNSVLACTLFVYWVLKMVGVSALEWILAHKVILMIVAELINAFVVASLTEELCKYYMFRMVDHPDLTFMNNETVCRAFPVSKTNNATSADDNTKVNSMISKSTTNQSQNTFVAGHDAKRAGGDPEDATMTSEDYQLHQDTQLCPKRTARQKAAAVTIAMLSVAVGLACAENVLYVYYLGGAQGGSAEEEFLTLAFRSIFPIHALCAALQSVGVIRRYIERDTNSVATVGVGRTVFPSLVLHGCFDAVLMIVSIFMEGASASSNDDDDDDYFNNDNDDGDVDELTQLRDTWLNVIAWTGVTMITILGAVWYFWQKGRQKERLKLIDREDGLGDELEASRSYDGPPIV